MTSTITKTAFFDTSPEVLWQFLTQKDKLGLWYLSSDHDWAEGKDFELYRISDDGNKVKKVWGQVLEMDQPKSLTYTFYCEANTDKPTTVHYLLESILDGTRLTITHEGVVEACGTNAMNVLMSLDIGWDEHLAQLRQANTET